MRDKCQKLNCHNPPYTERSIILDSLIGKVELYFCHSHFIEMMRTRMQVQIFELEKEIHRGQQAPTSTANLNW